MTKVLRIPDEPRFVRAFALAVDPGDVLALLMEIGALGARDTIIVRRTREALIPAYDLASERKDWDQTHTISILREALAQPDPVAFLAYRHGDSHRTVLTASEYAETLAIIGCAADTLSIRRRPWEIEPRDLSLPEWRERIRKLLFDIPGNALLKPSTSRDSAESGCICNESGSPEALIGDHASWCPRGLPGQEQADRSDEEAS